MDSFEEELKHDFLNEAFDLITNAESAFLRLEDERSDSELLNEIFRLAHNLKGTSRAVGFSQLAELTHIAENLILNLKEGKLEVSDQIVSTLLEFKDMVQTMIEGLKESLDATFDIDMIVIKLEATAEGKLGDKLIEPETAEEVVEEEVVEEENEFVDAAEFAKEESEVAETPKQDEELDFLLQDQVKDEILTKEAETNILPISNIKEEAPKEEAPKKESKKSSSTIEESIRVNLSKIDGLNNIVGELVILQTVMGQRRFEHIKDELSNSSIGMMEKLFKEVQELAMSLRMLPLKNTFQKMNRIVRDTSNALGKNVKLHLVGEETEVDKTVLEKLADPLVHIIRNSVDHGLESIEGRKEAGKEEVGNVELLAYHEGSNLVIQITDDGKGIDPEVIRKLAINKNIINENTEITDHQLIQLIFHPGFSTKEKVTEVSGRGVGMDVVKTNINSLGGEVQLQSKIGKGTSLKITLPLTLAIIEGIVISAADEKFVIPLSQIFELTQAKSDQIEVFTNIAHLFKLRGEVIPLFYLNEKLGKKVEKDESQIVVVIKGLNSTFGIVIDDVVNQQQIVIKKLGQDIQESKGIMGSAIMGDGKPSLILDLFELFRDDIKQSSGYKKKISVQNAS